MVGTYIPPSALIEDFETTFDAYLDVDLLFDYIDVSLVLPEMIRSSALWTDSELYQAFALIGTFFMSDLIITTYSKLDNVFARMSGCCNFMSGTAPVDTNYPILFIEASSLVISN
ncbi:hypothetical protein DSO57_1036267 [Entomophthora muscae]|uniref:Uncharacterized protein n=1 Tax=Entomophthora muscae TaxID=34485 RepID=A0ACC2S1E4_9FUNG|nr:hypothetical protein DSO57_1036267 [Entomophthora muscae]